MSGTLLVDTAPEAAADGARWLGKLTQFRRWSVRQFGWLSYLAQFGLVGATGMAVDLLCFALLAGYLSLGFARAASIGLAMSWNYALNRCFTFSESRRQPIWKQYLLFCGSCLAGAVINWLVSVSLCTFSDHTPIAAALVGVVAGFAFNFVLSRRFVFRG